MPFVALNPDGERICSLDHDDLRLEYRPGDFTCQLCGGEMVYKHGTQVRSHFAHKTACTSDYEHKPESREHRDAKYKIRDLLMTKYPGAKVDLEVPLPEIRRIADVHMDLNGWREVFEVQLSSITVEQIEARTQDYESLNITAQWWIGGAADTPAIKQWCIEQFGEFNSIEVYASAA